MSEMETIIFLCPFLSFHPLPSDCLKMRATCQQLLVFKSAGDYVKWHDHLFYLEGENIGARAFDSFSYIKKTLVSTLLGTNNELRNVMIDWPGMLSTVTNFVIFAFHSIFPRISIMSHDTASGTVFNRSTSTWRGCDRWRPVVGSRFVILLILKLVTRDADEMRKDKARPLIFCSQLQREYVK